jgi:hypothetical protein
MENAVPLEVLVFVVIFWICFLLGIIGYVMNAYKLFTRGQQRSNILAFRIVGLIFPAIGAIVGWF